MAMQVEMDSLHPVAARRHPHITERRSLQWVFIGIALFLLLMILILPLISVLVQGFGHGIQAYTAAIRDPDVLSALRLTVITALLVVPLNTLFGLAAAWCLTKFSFRGK